MKPYKKSLIKFRLFLVAGAYTYSTVSSNHSNMNIINYQPRRNSLLIITSVRINEYHIITSKNLV